MNKDSSIITERLLSRITPAAAGAAVFLSALVAGEWLLGTLDIARISERFVPMAPATALCVMLLGLGMLVRTDRSVIDRRVSLFLISAAFLISALLLADSSLNVMTGVHVDLERIVTRERDSGMGFVIGRMSPLTALILVLLSAGMTGWRLRKGTDAAPPIWAHWFGLASLLTAGLFLVGYAYGKPALFGQTITPMALPTAVALFLLSAALLFDGSDAVVHAMMKSKAIQDRIMRAIAPLIMFIILTTGWLFHLLAGSEIETQEVIEIYLTAVLAGAATVSATVLMSRRMKADVEKANEALRQNRAMLADILNSVPQSVFWKDRNSVYLGCNEKFAKAAGLAGPEQIVGKTDYDLPWPPHEAEAYRADDQEVILSNRSKRHITEPLQISDGSRLWIDTTKVPLADAGGKPYGVLGVYEDITEQKNAEEARKHLSEIVERSLNEIYVFDSETLVFKHVNHGALKNLQYTLEEIKKKTPLDLKPEFTEESFRAMIGPLLTGARDTVVFETVHRRADNSRYPVEVHLQLVNYRKERVFLAVIYDITERKRAEEALERANTEWSAAMDASNDIIYLLDIDRCLIRGNKMFYQMTHTEPIAVAGRPIADIVHPQGEATPCPVCRAQMERRDAVVVMEADHPDNSAGRPIEIMVRIVRDKLNNPISIFMSLHDLTHEREMQQSQKKLEEQLRQSQKMEAIGQLAGGVAHDFNNMLSAIIGYGHLTLMKMREDDPLRYNIDQLLEASQRATVLVQSLLTFSRKQPVKMEHLELNAELAQFEKFLSRLLREDIELKTRYSGDDLTIMADRGQIEQVIMNLVTNARDAMPGKGELSIETKSAVLDEGFAAAHGYGRPGKYAMISVTDTGAGMDERTKRRIFEPFFTTKEQGKGTGLGLATVYGIVKTHDGFINVYSEPGRGTAFHVYLPLGGTGAGATDSVPQTQLPMKRGAETILLAEDDASLRKMTSTVLRHMGYIVIEAENGREAVAKFQENKDAVHLVILDGIMPRMNGKEAYQEILSFAPQVRCIFMSGYAEEVFTRDGILQTDVKFLSKPATPSALLHAVREVLDR